MKKFILPAFLLAFPAMAASKNFLSVQVTPPAHATDWKTPGSFVKSMLKARLFIEARPYGTVTAFMYCMKTPVNEYEIAVEPKNFDFIGPLLFQGQGLGYFFATHEGHFLETRAVRSISGENNPDMRGIRFTISDEHCARISEFLGEFKKNKIADKWGLPHRPLMGEGATSASLVAAIMRVAGLMTDVELQSWERTLYLPKTLSGAPLTDEYVGIFKLLGGDWGSLNGDNTVVTFYDPVRMHSWIGQKSRNMDKSGSPVPRGTFWEQANDSIFHKAKN